jgi:hypothetical protein
MWQLGGGGDWANLSFENIQVHLKFPKTRRQFYIFYILLSFLLAANKLVAGQTCTRKELIVSRNVSPLQAPR